MKTCTCPRIATRNGFVFNGHDARCPFHGVTPDAQGNVTLVATVTRGEIGVVTERARPGEAIRNERDVPWCVECGLFHDPGLVCDFVDEN